MALAPLADYGLLGGVLVGMGLGILLVGFEAALDAGWLPRWFAPDDSRRRQVVEFLVRVSVSGVIVWLADRDLAWFVACCAGVVAPTLAMLGLKRL